MNATNSTPVKTLPAIAPGHRLVPTQVGDPARPQMVWIECPHWCEVQHHLIWNRHVEDVNHYGPGGGLQVATLANEDTAAHEMYANITYDPFSDDPRLQAAHIVVNTGTAVDAYLTPDMADELVDDLIGLAAEIRHAARTARLANQATGLKAVAA